MKTASSSRSIPSRIGSTRNGSRPGGPRWKTGSPCWPSIISLPVLTRSSRRCSGTCQHAWAFGTCRAVGVSDSAYAGSVKRRQSGDRNELSLRVFLRPAVESHGILANGEVSRVVHPRAGVAVDSGRSALEQRHMAVAVNEQVDVRQYLELTVRHHPQSFATVAGPVRPARVGGA